jgi:hypothetical protein
LRPACRAALGADANVSIVMAWNIRTEGYSLMHKVDVDAGDMGNLEQLLACGHFLVLGERINVVPYTCQRSTQFHSRGDRLISTTQPSMPWGGVLSELEDGSLCTALGRSQTRTATLHITQLLDIPYNRTSGLSG